MPPSDLGNGRDSAAQDPYAPDTVVSGVLSGVLGQVEYLSCSTIGNTWNDLQNRLVHAQAHPRCHGTAG